MHILPRRDKGEWESIRDAEENEPPRTMEDMAEEALSYRKFI